MADDHIPDGSNADQLYVLEDDVLLDDPYEEMINDTAGGAGSARLQAIPSSIYQSRHLRPNQKRKPLIPSRSSASPRQVTAEGIEEELVAFMKEQWVTREGVRQPPHDLRDNELNPTQPMTLGADDLYLQDVEGTKKSWKYYHKKLRYPVSFPEVLHSKPPRRDGKTKHVVYSPLPWQTKYEAELQKYKTINQTAAAEGPPVKKAPKRSQKGRRGHERGSSQRTSSHATKDDGHRSLDKELTPEELEEAQQCFALFDPDATGYTTIEFVRQTINQLDPTAPMTQAELNELFRENRNEGRISFEEFLDSWKAYVEYHAEVERAHASKRS